MTRYYAFFDAEYTCYMDSDRNFDRKHSSEVLSVGLVIADRNFKVVKTYYSPICPIYNKKLTPYCRELTGLTQKEIDHAPSWEEVFRRLIQILQEYPVKEIAVWGNDNQTLTADLERNHRSVSKKHKKLVSMIKDVTRRMTAKVFGTGITVSLADMKYVCDMEHKTAHNALEDAKDLYRIVKACMKDTYNKGRAEKLYTYIQERDEYHRHRRFRHPDRHIEVVEDRKLREASLDYIRVLKEIYGQKNDKIPPQVLAMCDDVRSLAGMTAFDCPKLEEEK
ncbi:MAG: exonuclease domain-containing protein [Eubacterium sp.]|nr:exonuclease domain-containing protein [Eubacterium sp.]